MRRSDLPDLMVDLAKILGRVVIDTLDVGDYRIALIIERKVDDKMGVIVENISIEKRMSTFEVKVITERFKDLVEKK